MKKLDTNAELEGDAKRLCSHSQTFELLADLVSRNARAEGPTAILVLIPIQVFLPQVGVHHETLHTRSEQHHQLLDRTVICLLRSQVTWMLTGVLV